MENKNLNYGTLNSNGGLIHIGDSNITVQIKGLSILLNEFKVQLETIENLIHEFKPRTALHLLEDIESRIRKNEILDNTTHSKILFLKASCKRELREYPVENTAQEFIHSFKLNKADSKLKETACIEYLNLNEIDKSLELAEKILILNEFNITAWCVKVLSSNQLKESLDEVPNVVRKNLNFQQTVIYHIIKTQQLNYIEELDRYDLSINIDSSKYQKLTFENKQGWVIVIDLLVNQIINEFPIRYISGGNFIIEFNDKIAQVINMLQIFVDTLKETEIREAIYHQEFFLHYFKYIKSKDSQEISYLNEIYDLLPKNNWFYTVIICQVLNHNKNFSKSLKLIEDYEKDGGEMMSEIYLFKASTLFIDNRSDEINEVYNNYLEIVDIIDERSGFNILNVFLNVLRRVLNKDLFEVESKKIFNKKFKNAELKELFEISCRIRYFDNDNKQEEDLFSRLQQIINYDFDKNYKNLIAENLYILNKNEEALNFLDKYIDKSKISEELKFYIILLSQKLLSNKDTGRGIYIELLELLKFYRENSSFPDEELLGIEHNINLLKNDWNELKKIDSYLYHSFPENELYLLFYLQVLEKLDLIKELKEVVSSIKEKYQDEVIGVNISKLLLRNKIDLNKGSRIMFFLASNPLNSEARKFYLGISHLFKEDFFKKFDIIEKGVWVKYSINLEQVEEIQVLKDNGFQSELIGKKVGDKFTKENNLTNKVNTIEILQIYNDELRLHYEIQKEVQNPVNELGFSSLSLPDNKEDFADFLISQFGQQGSLDKERNEKSLNDYYNYKIGFSEVTRSVFRDSPINAYLNLTKNIDTKFTTLPALITQPINLNQDIKYALDFTSLFLFFELERDLEFQFNKKFIISYYLKEWIRLEAIEEKNSPKSEFTVQITNEGLQRYDLPENYKSKRVEFYESVLIWIDNNCIIDLVEEKLDIAMSLQNYNGKTDMSIKFVIDNMHLSMRENYRFISSDSTIFLFQQQRGLKHNIVDPEKYLLAFHNIKCDTVFYRFLLKNNYLGINIYIDTLKNEFYSMLLKKENYYQKCLDNMQFSVNNNPTIILVAIIFLKDLYLMNTINYEEKNQYSFEVFKFTFVGMSIPLINHFEQIIKKEFILLGESYDEVLKTFDKVKKLFGL